ncbi:putative GAF sensor protein [Hymenobacter roseosalivarius DSM 11622]|uniref:Putative GAF sensor protein n=1 Tax=Hymenobacter roseosalivarius DSM 11622 TaxID=645990 RepID=A0A1W1W685_9BACT|nr:GAF domain-containing protein [Hymenobacter roseosalivarius]SMC00614.1 putative GAF sensor protein [Hymenobacter roseosalivarius DSM 11622]
MLAAPLPPNESERLKSLHAHNLLDTLPEDVYDDITRLAAEICGTPIAAINLVAEDRQWSKSAHHQEGESLGLHHYLRAPREYSFCAYTILNPNDVLVVPDARYDERFMDNPFTTGEPHVVFYAGVPVKDAEGLALGSLCVLDSRPRELAEHKLESLKALAKLVNTHFQLRRTKLELEKAQQRVDAAAPLLCTMMSATDALRTNAEGETASRLTSLQEEIISLKTILKVLPE